VESPDNGICYRRNKYSTKAAGESESRGDVGCMWSMDGHKQKERGIPGYKSFCSLNEELFIGKEVCRKSREVV